MGRRDLAIYVLLAVLGLGGSAVLAGLLAPHSAITTMLVYGGALAIVGSVFGLATLFATTPSGASRLFLSPEITPETLEKMIHGRTSVQIAAIEKPYLKKWMRIEGVVSGVGDIIFGIRMVHIKWNQETLVSGVFRRKWSRQLLVLNRGDRITFVGKVSGLGPSLSLEGCEMERIAASSAGDEPTSPSAA